MKQLRDRYAAKMRRLEERIRRAQGELSQAESEFRQESMDTAISIGRSIFGALFSRKKLSRTNVDRASSSARKAGRVAREKEDVQRAKDSLDVLLQQRMELDDKISADVAKIEAKYQSDRIDLERLEIRPRKSDILVEPVMIVWTPWFVDNSDISMCAFR